MVSVSHCSFAFVCVILLMTPFSTIPSTEARQLVVQQKSFASSLSSFNFNGLYQKLNDLLTKGFGAVGGSLDVSGNGGFVITPQGVFLAIPIAINKDAVTEVSTCTANILSKFGLQKVAGVLVVLDQAYSLDLVTSTIQSSGAVVIVFTNGVFITNFLSVSAIAQKITAFYQYIPQLFQKIEGLPQCLTKA